MPPVPVPPPPPPPYVYVITGQQTGGYRDPSLTSTMPVSSRHTAPPQPPPELRICIADSNEATRILLLPGLEREETIKHLADSCLSRLGGVPQQANVSVRTEASPDSGIILVITFLSMVLAVPVAAVAVRDILGRGSAWAGFITGLPAAWRLLRRSVGLGYPLTFNDTMLIGLAINYARSNDYGSGTPIDACYIEPWQLYSLDNPPMRAHRDTLGVLTCDELPHPRTLYGFVITRAGRLLTYCKTILPSGIASPTYSLLRNAEIVTPKLDVKRSQEIAAKLPPKSKDMLQSALRVGIFSRARGLIYLRPGENAEIEIDNWPPVSRLMAASARTSLISAETFVRQQPQRQTRSKRRGKR